MKIYEKEAEVKISADCQIAIGSGKLKATFDFYLRPFYF